MKKMLLSGSICLTAFGVWTALIRLNDVQPLGPNGTEIGLAGLNEWFHRLTGVHMSLYTLTDWLGLVPLVVCLIFAGIGLVQWIKRKSLCRVDTDILILGVYYAVVILAYLLFEMIPVNYRPVLIEGRLEASYPSSTTLLVLCVMPTLVEQVQRRLSCLAAKRLITLLSAVFSVSMVIGRLVCGVHWLTDIAGGILLSGGLVCLYLAAMQSLRRKEGKRRWNFTKNCRSCEKAED